MARVSKAQVGSSEIVTWLRNQKALLQSSPSYFCKKEIYVDKWKNKVVEFRCRWILFEDRVELSMKGCYENPTSKL
jgi:hypothetical protein